MADAPIPGKEALGALLLDIMKVLLEFDSQLISMRSALSDLSYGDAEAARKSIDEAYNSNKIHEAMSQALSRIDAWVRETNV